MVGIWNLDLSGFWMVEKRLGCKWPGQMAPILSKTIWNPDILVLCLTPHLPVKVQRSKTQLRTDSIFYHLNVLSLASFTHYRNQIFLRIRSTYARSSPFISGVQKTRKHLASSANGSLIFIRDLVKVSWPGQYFYTYQFFKLKNFNWMKQVLASNNYNLNSHIQT